MTGGEPIAELSTPKVESLVKQNPKPKEPNANVIKVGSYVNTEAIKNKEKAKLANVREKIRQNSDSATLDSSEAEAELPVIKTLAELGDLIQDMDPKSLFLRWTPDIKREMNPGYESRWLLHDTDTPQKRTGQGHGGVSAFPLDPMPERGYGLSDQFSYPIGGKPRKYYLIQGEVALENHREVLLKSDSMVPIAEIDNGAVYEANIVDLAYDRVRRRLPNGGVGYGPGQLMSEVASEIESWPPLKSAEGNAMRRRIIESARAEIPAPLEEPKQPA